MRSARRRHDPPACVQRARECPSPPVPPRQTMTTRRCERRRAPRRQRTSIAIDVPSLHTRVDRIFESLDRIFESLDRETLSNFKAKRPSNTRTANGSVLGDAVVPTRARPIVRRRRRTRRRRGHGRHHPFDRRFLHRRFHRRRFHRRLCLLRHDRPRRVSPRRYLRRRLPRGGSLSLFRGVSLSLFRVTSRPVRRVIPPLYQRSPIDTVSTAALVALIAPLTVPRLRGSSGLLVEDVPVLRTVRARLCQHLRIGQKRVNLRRVFGVGEIGSILGDLRRRRRTSLVATVRLPGTDSVRVGRRRLAGRRNRSAGRRRDRRR